MPTALTHGENTYSKKMTLKNTIVYFEGIIILFNIIQEYCEYMNSNSTGKTEIKVHRKYRNNKFNDNTGITNTLRIHE